MLSNYTREFKQNIRLAFPIILGLLGHTLVGLFDNIMVGKLGTAELAAASLGNSFLFISLSIILGFSTGITPLVAAADANKETSNIRSLLKNGLFLTVLLSVVLTGIIFLIRPVLYHMDQPREVVDLAIPYLNIIAVSLIPLGFFQAFKQFSDGLSQTKYAMVATIVANVINVVLNYFLIYGVWIFPELGIVGAAYATLISRIVMAFMLYVLLVQQNKFKVYLINFYQEKIVAKTINNINKLGLPSALQMFFEFGLFTAAIWMSGILGKNPQAANQIALNLSSMTFMFAMGIGVVAIIRVGNQYGLKKYHELRRIAISTFLLILILDIIFALFFIAFNSFLPTLYLDVNDIANAADNQEVINISAKLLIIAGVFQIFDGIQAVVVGALKGIQDVIVPTLLIFISYMIIACPVSYILGIHLGYGAEGLWIGLLVGLVIASILLLIRFNTMSNKFLK